MLKHLIEDLVVLHAVPPANITFFDFSDERAVALRPTPDEIVSHEPPGLVAGLPRFFFFDEITGAFPDDHASWALWLKRAVDRFQHRGFRFVVTDSAAPMLRGGKESGLGRWDDERLEPLSFNEFLDLNAVGSETSETVFKRVPTALDLYLTVGGFPEQAITTDPSRLSVSRRRLREDITNKAIYRDLQRNHLDVERVHALFVYLLEDSGLIFDPMTRSRLLTNLGTGKPVDHRSLRAWVDALKDSMLVCELELFGKTPQKKLIGRAYPKLYAADPGLVTAFALAREPLADPHVRGRATEAAVFRHVRELAREMGGRCSYVRGPDGDSEIDFLLSADGMRVGIEVKSGAASENDLEAFRRASARWKVDHSLLVHAGASEQTTGVQVVSLRDFLFSPSRWVHHE